MRFIRNGDLQLCLETHGQGPAHVLFAHGWISSRRIWRGVAGLLDPARFTSHLLDFRGAGLSDRPREGHDLEGYASDLRAAIEAIDRPLIVAGHSAGGKIAQYVAAHSPPGNLRGLLLVAPGSASVYPTSPRHRQRALEAYGSRQRIGAFQRASMARPPAPEVLQCLIEDALVAQFEAWMGWYDHGRSADFSDRLRELKLPCLALAGGRDGLASERRVRAEVTERIAGAQFILLRDVGHNLPVEAPEAVAQAVARLADRTGLGFTSGS